MERYKKKFKSCKLIFRASEHGYTPAAFHSKCDNKGPTVTLVHNSFNKTFGGFTKESWDTTEREPKDLESFLFSLDVNQKYEFNNSGRAIHCSSMYGAVFGKGSDFRINSNFKEP